MNISGVEVPTVLPSSKNTGGKPKREVASSQPKVKPKKRRKNRRHLFRQYRRSRPANGASQAKKSSCKSDSETETGDRNLCSSLDEAKNNKGDQFPENGASPIHTVHTSTPVKVALGGESDLSDSVREMNEEDQNIKEELLEHSGNEEEASARAIHTSTPVKVVLSSESDLSNSVREMNEEDQNIKEELLELSGNEEEASARAIHTSTPVKVVLSSESDLSNSVSQINEADQDIKEESFDHCGNREEASARAIRTSTPFKVNVGGELGLSFASPPSLLIDPSLPLDGIRCQMVIKNSDSTLSVTIGNDATQPSTPHLKIPTEGNIYSRIDEFRVPVIVDWSNSSLSSARTPSLLPSAESTLHGPEVMPQFAGVSVHLIDTLLKHLKFYLPVLWYPISDKEGVSATLHSTSGSGLKAVQKEVYVDYEQGSVRIGIHGKPLPEDHTIWNETGPQFPLCNDNVQAFTNRIVKIVNVVRQHKICPGIEATERSAKILSGKKHITFEDNLFGDMNVACYRPNNCSLLIPLRPKHCGPCSKFTHNILKSQRRAEAKGSTNNLNSDRTEGLKKTPCRHTRHDYLTESASKRLLKKKQKQIYLQQQTICRLRARITKMLETEGIDIDAQLSKDLKMVLQNNKLTEVQKVFLEQQIRCSKAKSKTGMRWHPIMIRFALHLKSISPAALDAVRQSGLIKLPCSQTLFDYSSVYKPESGNNSKIIADVAKKVSELKEPYQRFHSLMFDEITTSQNLVYSKETGELWGYAHLSAVSKEMTELDRQLQGEKELERPPPIANHMLTYMIKGTASGVKEAVASYPTANLTKEQLYERTWDVIGNLEMVGVAVVALISDGNLVNRAFYQMHVPVTKNDNGIVFDTINFCSGEGRTLYFFNDVPHLLKCIRNNFMSSGTGEKKTRCLIKNKQIITWDTIVRMFMEEKDETWSFGFKLNKQNVFPDSYSRMRVPLAAQVMSDTTSKMIGILGYKGCEETAIFIKKVNDFFDMLNGAHSDQEKKTRNKNLAKYDSPFDPRFDELLDFLKYLKEWKEEARAATKHLKKKDEACAARQLSWQTLESIERTVLAFIGCTRLLLANGQKYVMARVFCQDPLEQYFSRQRSMNGGNRNPNPLAFTRNMNTIHLLRETGFHRKRGNTENLSTEEMSLISTPLEKKPRHNTKRRLAENFPLMFQTD